MKKRDRKRKRNRNRDGEGEEERGKRKKRRKSAKEKERREMAPWNPRAEPEVGLRQGPLSSVAQSKPLA